MNELVKQEKMKQEETNSTKMAPEKEIKRPIVCVICEKSFDPTVVPGSGIMKRPM